MSVFILSGPSLKATAQLQGPISPTSVNSAKDLYQAAERREWTHLKDGVINFEQVLDFEHLNKQVEDDDDAELNTPVEKDIPLDPNDPNSAEKRRKRREKQREAFLEAKRKRDEKRMLQQKKIREDGEPFLYSAKAPVAGWYRVCVQATWYQVSPSQRFD